MKIRPMKVKDIQKVSELINKCLVKNNSRDYSKKIITEMKGKFSQVNIKNAMHNTAFIVATEKNSIIGVAGLKGNEVRSVFVNPANQLKGLGTKLMQTLENKAKRIKLKMIVAPSSITAKDFYSKIGYKLLKKENHPKYGTLFIMQKKLNNKE